MKLLILDGNSVINRAFFGVKPLTTREGLFTHAVFGFLNILEKLEKEEQPDAVCVSFDLHGPTFRHKMYDGYKATRHPMPEELAQQMPIIKEVLSAMNIPIYACQGWEADDVIGTVSRICSNNDWECVIATGDRFVADPDFCEALRAEYGAVSCEMETGAIAHVCAASGVPFSGLRAISDNANDDGKVDFMTFATDSAEKCITLLKAAAEALYNI